MSRPVALITGASAGLGQELARQFAAAGHDLILTARRRERLDALARELQHRHSCRCEVVVVDLACANAAVTVVTEIERRGWTVDVLVNNAGFGVYGPFAAAEPDRLRALMQVNIVALTELTRLLLPGMIARGHGRILNVASIASFMPGPLMAVYYASKAYVRSLSEALSEELRNTGVTVTCLCPGPVRTEFADTAGMAGAKLFDMPNTMTAEAVAAAAIRATRRGRRLVIPGFLNQLITIMVVWLPKSILLRVVMRLQTNRRQPAGRDSS